MKFAHISDCHLGGWKNEMQELNLHAFFEAIKTSIGEKVDFVLITGDLFDNAMPSVDILKETASKLRELKEACIPCYLIAGSHDYSASGKTFLDVLEKAGLCKNVASKTDEIEFFESKGILIAGISGKRQGLEMEAVKKMKANEKSAELKILALHTSLKEACPEFIDSISIDELPKGFDYYALGHIHTPFLKKHEKGMVVYPGALFPNNFSELEEIEGGFCIVEQTKEGLKVEREEIRLKEKLIISINAGNKSPEAVTREIIVGLKKNNPAGKIILLRISGTLSFGKTSDINFKEIDEAAKGCFTLLRNTGSLESPEFKTQVQVEAKDIEELENEIIKKHDVQEENDLNDFILPLIDSLDIEKQEGETNPGFEERIFKMFGKIMKIEGMLR